MAGYDNRHEVHKDESHCPANDEGARVTLYATEGS